MNNLKPVLTSVCFLLAVFWGVNTHADGAQLNPVAKEAQEAEPAATEQTPTKENSCRRLGAEERRRR